MLLKECSVECVLTLTQDGSTDHESVHS